MISAIIVAAGKGVRMGPNVDKLFLELHGQPVVAHTWRRFDQIPEIAEIILVVRDGIQSAFSELAEKCQFRKPFRLVPGGKERQDSVWNGLAALSPETEIVAIQDAARPCTPADLITATITAARETGAAVAASPVTDTIKESGDGKLIERTLDRSRLWAVQTPQTFRVEVIRRALSEVRRQGLQVTDDTAACELIQQPVRLVVRYPAQSKGHPVGGFAVYHDTAHLNMAATVIKSAIPVIAVTDSRRAEDYYCKTLGFEKLFAYRPDPTKVEPCYLGVARDGVILHLQSFKRERAGMTDAFLYVTDVDQLFAELSARGAICQLPPTDQTWGTREIGIRDPDGNILVFATQVEKSVG